MQSIVFPKSWRDIGVGNTVLNDFMERCNQMFSGRNITCQECDNPVEDPWFRTHRGTLYGIHDYTCYSCLKHFCYECEDNNGTYLLQFCELCQKDYCGECEPILTCAMCAKTCCKKCLPMKTCGECGNYCCGRDELCGSMSECRDCGIDYGDCCHNHECPMLVLVAGCT